jgi:hypothetical protein
VFGDGGKLYQLGPKRSFLPKDKYRAQPQKGISNRNYDNPEVQKINYINILSHVSD